MRINQNISAMNTHASMVKADTSMSKSLERLSSGYRINRAADDAAGLAISEKMRGQISGLKQATKNAQDGISLLQTAEGNLNETHSILQRMRELADQAANGTVTDSDRAEIQKEMNQLTKEVDRIAKDTEFNTMKLLRGKSVGVTTSGAAMTGGSAEVPAGADTPPTSASGVLDFSALAGADIDDAATVVIGGTTYTEGADFDSGTDLATTLGDLADAITGKGTYTATVSGNTIKLVTTDTGTDANDADFSFQVNDVGASGHTIGATTVALAGGADLVPGAAGTPAVASTGSLAINRQLAVGDSITIGAGGGAHTFTFVAHGAVPGAGQVELGTDAAGTISNLASALNTQYGAGFASANADGKTINLTDEDGGNLALATHLGADSQAADHITLTMQIGANAGQSMDVDINNMDAGSLGIGRDAQGNLVAAGTDATQGLDVTSSTTASNALTTIDTAINTVSSERSKLGAFQNRLDHTVSNLSTAAENLSASESRIRDVDMADEMSNFSRAQILMQASTAMMAQANQKPQAVLKLLG